MGRLRLRILALSAAGRGARRGRGSGLPSEYGTNRVAIIEMKRNWKLPEAMEGYIGVLPGQWKRKLKLPYMIHGQKGITLVSMERLQQLCRDDYRVAVPDSLL